MPCDTWLSTPQQTLTERKAEVRKAVDRFSQGLSTGRIKAKVGPQGAIAFVGVEDKERSGVTDACAYRSLMIHGSALAKAAIARAELIAGRSVDRKVVATGTHSHDGGNSWHSKG
jgi:hypothetical protein